MDNPDFDQDNPGLQLNTVCENLKSESAEDNPSNNFLNVISNQEKQYDNCHEIVDIYGQESKQQLASKISDSKASCSNEDSKKNCKPMAVLDGPEAEEILKSNEVLSNFDKINAFDSSSGVLMLNSSPNEIRGDGKSCLTQECQVSIPNIHNLLSNDDSGRTDACQVENSLDLIRNCENELDDFNTSAEVQNLEARELSCFNRPSKNSADDSFSSTWSNLESINENGNNFDASFSTCNSLDMSMASKSSLKRLNSSNLEIDSPNKKSKKGITFDSVSVYYFPRTQGFTCIPSQGGSTLGMSWNHSHTKRFSLGEHAAEQRRAHRQFCNQQFPNSRNWNDVSTISSEDSDSDEIISDSEMDYENYNFLQPIPTRERRAMLRAAGIHKIDSTEKDECRNIRSSREFCGCTCQIYCDPDRCDCAQAGIKCQVDRMNFPCSCTREGCANENGRIEFNPVRVRTHYIHTLMRLEMEKKKEEEEQRNKLLLNNLDSNAHLPYSSTSTLDLSGNNLMNFSYHNDLQSYYSQPPISYGGTSTSSIVNSCFNFTYAAANDQFVIPSTASASIAYHESMNSSMRLGTTNTSSMDYCCQLTSASTDCLHSNDYNNDLLKDQDNQNFVIRDLTNGSESNNSNVPYNSESFIQLGNENFGQHIENASHQVQQLDATLEANEETEKEESDSENFGNIIKKTMVETVIA